MITLRDKKIIVCPRCKGEGRLRVSADNEDRCEIVCCNVCNGERVVMRETIVRYNSMQNADKSEEESPTME